MRRSFLLILLAASALALCGPVRAPAGWGAGGCFAPAMSAVAGPVLAPLFAPAVVIPPRSRPFVPSVVAPAAAHGWESLGDGQWALWQSGQQIGVFVEDAGYYERFGPGQFAAEPSDPPAWAPPVTAGKRKCGCCKGCACKSKKCGCTKDNRCNADCKCGVKVIGKGEQPPCSCRGDDCQCATKPCAKPACKCVLQGAEALALPVEDVTQNFGVATEKIDTQERCSIGGVTHPKSDLFEALQAPIGPVERDEVPDDCSKLSATIGGGTAEQRAKIRADLELPQFTSFRERVLVQDYDADSPMLKCGFKVSADHPTIYLQLPAGVKIGEELDEKTGQMKPRYSVGGEVLARVDHYEGPQTWEAVRKADPNYHPDADPDPTKPKPTPSPPGPQPQPAPDGGGWAISWPWVFGIVSGLGCFASFALLCIGGIVLLVRSRK